MKKIVSLMLLMIILMVSACAPQATATPTVAPTTTKPTATLTVEPPAAPSLTRTAAPTKRLATPTKVNLKAGQRLYTNDAFKLAIKYPVTWIGPSESMDGDHLSVNFDSFERMSVFLGAKEPIVARNAYYRLQVDYKRNQPADELMNAKGGFYDTASTLKDGETYISRNSDGSELSEMLRLRALHIGRFTGFEFVLFGSGERYFSRRIVLFDAQRKDGIAIDAYWDVDIDIADAKKWREAYERGEKASSPSLKELYEMIESIRVE